MKAGGQAHRLVDMNGWKRERTSTFDGLDKLRTRPFKDFLRLAERGGSSKPEATVLTHPRTACEWFPVSGVGSSNSQVSGTRGGLPRRPVRQWEAQQQERRRRKRRKRVTPLSPRRPKAPPRQGSVVFLTRLDHTDEADRTASPCCSARGKQRPPPPGDTARPESAEALDNKHIVTVGCRGGLLRSPGNKETLLEALRDKSSNSKVLQERPAAYKRFQ
ncbi:hypothetical protein O3P69_000722 [Scylla paramamosain]|uniref:Uncharacterized protein n=1 Tax=Scylla paramamosain TaxID=85552 RepID=A0AAW0USQ0_SCYPA